MAHIYDIPVEPAYVKGKRATSRTEYPKGDVFRGFNSPSRFEGEVFDLEVFGEIPKAIDGTFYRIQPDHRFPPMYEEDIHFNGDGSISAFRIHDGHVDYQQAYVKTDRYMVETKYRKNLFGKYRNPFTDDPVVEGVIRTASNTNIIFHRGVLLATKEDGPPFAMDPTTLDTIGKWDFNGQITTPTFTAHPKFDPDTGEMICFGYEAGGTGQDGSCDIVVYTIDADGRKTEEAWYKGPFCGMIHDCAITKNYVILPMTPIECKLDRMKRGGAHWAWNPKLDQCYGVVPRRGGKADDIRWFRSDNAFHGHVAGAYETEDGEIIMDLTVADAPEEDEGSAGSVAARNKLNSPMTRWKFNPKDKTDTRYKPYTTMNTSGEFARIDDRFVTKYYKHFFLCVVDPSRPYDFAKCGPPTGGLFNCLGHFNWETGEQDIWFAGPTSTVQEPVFIPRSKDAEEGDGYLLGLVNRLDEMRNDLVVLDTRVGFEKGPVAVIRLPLKLKIGLHGNFVPYEEIEAWRERTGDNKKFEMRKMPKPFRAGEQETNGANGVNRAKDTNGVNGLNVS